MKLRICSSFSQYRRPDFLAVLHLNVVDNSDAPSDQIRARFPTHPVPTTPLMPPSDPATTPAGRRCEPSASTLLRRTERQLAPAAAERRAVLVHSNAALSVRRPSPVVAAASGGVGAARPVRMAVRAARGTPCGVGQHASTPAPTPGAGATAALPAPSTTSDGARPPPSA